MAGRSPFGGQAVRASTTVRPMRWLLAAVLVLTLAACAHQADPLRLPDCDEVTLPVEDNSTCLG